MPKVKDRQAAASLKSGQAAISSTPKPSDLKLHVAAKFLTQVLGFLPHVCAIPASECHEIGHQKYADQSDQNDKLAHTVNVSVRHVWMINTKQPPSDVRFSLGADFCRPSGHVRFVPQADVPEIVLKKERPPHGGPLEIVSC